MNVEFDRLEGWASGSPTTASPNTVVCSFKTKTHGYIQVDRIKEKSKTVGPEPSLYNFTEEERQYIDEVGAIVYRLVFDGTSPEKYQ